jgi:DNA-binding transcriptional ArsR family regulator
MEQQARTATGHGQQATRLANLNLFRAATLAEVRREISILLAEHLRSGGDRQRVTAGREFVFCQQRLVIMPCHAEASNAEEFLAALRKVEIQSVGYHLFQSRAMPSGGNDFTRWFNGWGHTDLARQIDSFDSYLNSLEDNRTYLAEMVERWLRRREKGVGNA